MPTSIHSMTRHEVLSTLEEHWCRGVVEDFDELYIPLMANLGFMGHVWDVTNGGELDVTKGKIPFATSPNGKAPTYTPTEILERYRGYLESFNDTFFDEDEISGIYLKEQASFKNRGVQSMVGQHGSYDLSVLIYGIDPWYVTEFINGPLDFRRGFNGFKPADREQILEGSQGRFATFASRVDPSRVIHVGKESPSYLRIIVPDAMHSLAGPKMDYAVAAEQVKNSTIYPLLGFLAVYFANPKQFHLLGEDNVNNWYHHREQVKDAYDPTANWERTGYGRVVGALVDQEMTDEEISLAISGGKTRHMSKFDMCYWISQKRRKDPDFTMEPYVDAVKHMWERPRE